MVCLHILDEYGYMDDDVIERLRGGLRRTSITRLLDPSVMGPPIVWLASPEAAGVHGRRIVANDFTPAAEPAP